MDPQQRRSLCNPSVWLGGREGGWLAAPVSPSWRHRRREPSPLPSTQPTEGSQGLRPWRGSNGAEPLGGVPGAKPLALLRSPDCLADSPVTTIALRYIAVAVCVGWGPFRAGVIGSDSRGSGQHCRSCCNACGTKLAGAAWRHRRPGRGGVRCLVPGGDHGVVSAPVMRRDQRFHRVCPLANRGEPCLALSFA